jgi:hypothetical protein
MRRYYNVPLPGAYLLGLFIRLFFSRFDGFSVPRGF